MSYGTSEMSSPEEFTRLIRDHPENIGGWLLAGSYLLDEKRFDEAARHFERAVEIDNESSAAHAGLARAQLHSNRLSDARANLLKSIKLRPTAARWTLLGFVNQRLGDAPAAEQAYNEAIALDPAHAEAYLNLAYLLKAYDPERATALLRHAASLDPEDSRIHAELGQLLLERGELDGAEQALKRSITLDEKQLWAHLALGNLSSSL